MTDDLSLKIAAFVIQALDLGDEPTALAPEVVALKRDLNAGISSLELDSSIGPAAFLVYHYLLDVLDAEGRSGRDLFDADLATLERAATHDSPGPRILAHATAGDEAYVLATTPATHRALTGAPPLADLEATAADLLPGAETAETRRTAAADLLRLLREADGLAAAWLRAIQAEGRLAAGDTGAADLLAFNEDETALALFLLDDRSIGNLLRALNLLISSARQQATDALGGDQSR
ncbi:MAG TPA: hypothetical protein VH482_14125 [Thermomicrobiales bacterium]|jgi:hypothetical protein